MANWFTIEKIDSDTYAISEYQHWEEAHCYLLCGADRAVLIDTGMGIANIKAVVDHLTDLPVTALLTHAHWDHIGGLAGHHQLVIPTGMIEAVANAFESLDKQGLLRQGSGVFEFEDFQIHI